jgi:hypothetical protein
MMLIAPLLLAACGAGADNAASNDQAAQAAQPSLAGDWRVVGALENSQEGYHVRMTDIRQTYFTDKTSSFAGQLTIKGADLPAAGLAFKVSGDGRWSQEGKVLRDDSKRLSLEPVQDSPDLHALADKLEGHLQQEPTNIYDILELGPKTLRIRDRRTGKEIAMKRA